MDINFIKQVIITDYLKMRSNFSWQLVYCYKLSFWRRVSAYICAIFIPFVFVAFCMLASGNSDAVAGLFWLPFAIYSIVTLTYPSRLKDKLKENNIEMYDDTKLSKLMYVKTNEGKIGVLKKNGISFVLEPIYLDIFHVGDIFVVQNQDGLWGAYNLSLSKMVLPCEHPFISVNGMGNIVVITDSKLFEYSPYGSLISQTNKE